MGISPRLTQQNAIGAPSCLASTKTPTLELVTQGWTPRKPRTGTPLIATSKMQPLGVFSKKLSGCNPQASLTLSRMDREMPGALASMTMLGAPKPRRQTLFLACGINGIPCLLVSLAQSWGWRSLNSVHSGATYGVTGLCSRIRIPWSTVYSSLGCNGTASAPTKT